MTEDDLKKIEAMMAHQVGIAMEDARHHFAILGEGHQMLVERIDRMDARLQRVEEKVDTVAVEVAAHRADTEAHRGIYGVRES